MVAYVPQSPLLPLDMAARDYVLVNSRATGKITQLNFGGFISGDTGSFFELPGDVDIG